LDIGYWLLGIGYCIGMNAFTLRYLSRRDVESLGIPMSEVVAIVEEMFREKGAGHAEMPPKPGIHPAGDAFIHAMPGFLPRLGAAGVKWISGYPDNRERGLPYISGLLILNDPDTGLPTAVMDATWITAVRTGAATAVAAHYLARADSRSAAILACGVQGRTNLEALRCVLPIERVLAYDVDRAAAQTFAVEMRELHGVAVDVASEPEAAVREADVVVTSGPILRHPTPTLRAEWLRPGTFVCPLDFDSYLTPEAFARADRVATDDVRQMAHYRTVGYFARTPEPYADLGEIVTGAKPGRESAEEITISVNLGLALEDVALGRVVLQRAQSRGVGVQLER
jgi:ornithine cyclodeaminase/alanine dehydrogenase-like protein (mu-crystallin family)